VAKLSTRQHQYWFCSISQQKQQVIWAKLMRCATTLAVPIHRLSWSISIHFDAIHTWNLRRSQKLQNKNT